MESCVVEMRGGQIETVSAPSRFEPESIRPAIRPGCESPVTRRIEITQISSPEWSMLKERVLRFLRSFSYLLKKRYRRIRADTVLLYSIL